MSIMRKEGSGRIISEVTDSDRFTEQVLKSSGLDYTVLYHPPFADLLSFYYDSNPIENGIKVPANDGKMAPATRDELAEAHAEILSTPGHENKIYSLGGSYHISFSEIAKVLSEIKGQPVSFTTITAEEYIDGMVEKGVARHVAEFLTSWVMAIEGGEFEHQAGDLERLLGRKTKSFTDVLETSFV
jgi:NAD(P)H dehydrogenase (quinone)